MLKKLMALTIIATMLLSSFGIIAQAEYGYDYWELICGRSKTTTYSPLANYRAYMQGSSNEAAQGKYYLYNSTGKTGELIQFNNQTATDVVKFTDHVFDLNTMDYAGDWYYSKGTGNYANLRLQQPNSSNMPSDWSTANTMTWNVKVKFEEKFVLANFIGSTSKLNARDINLFRITDTGMLMSGPLGTTSNDICQLELNTTYDIGLVMKYIPTSTQGVYNVVKSIYVNDVYKYSISASTTFTSDLTFYDMIIDVYPWSRATSIGADDSAKDTTYVDSTTLTDNLKSSLYKYTIIGTHFTVDDFTVYAGNKYAENQPSLDNTDTDFYISSNIRNNTNYVTVAAQTAEGDNTDAGTLMLATYNANKELVSIKTAAIDLTAGAITEQDIDISTEDANETKLFIVTNTGDVTPLAKSTVLN